MPFYKDRSALGGISEGLNDLNAHRVPAILASYQLNLHKMVKHALQLHKLDQLNQDDVMLITDAMTSIQPEQLTVFLAQDL